MNDGTKPPEPTVVEEKVEDRAVRHVIELERGLGREARDTRRVHGAPAGIASGDRAIEVKACTRFVVCRRSTWQRSPSTRNGSPKTLYPQERRPGKV